MIALTRRAAELDVPEAVQEEVRVAYEPAIHGPHVEEVLAAGQSTAADVQAASRQAPEEATAERGLLLALLEDEREAVLRLRDGHAIDDEVLRRMRTTLGAEEAHLRGVEAD